MKNKMYTDRWLNAGRENMSSTGQIIGIILTCAVLPVLCVLAIPYAIMRKLT